MGAEPHEKTEAAIDDFRFLFYSLKSTQKGRFSLRECGVAICCVVSSVAEEALVAQILVQVLPMDAVGRERVLLALLG